MRPENGARTEVRLYALQLLVHLGLGAVQLRGARVEGRLAHEAGLGQFLIAAKVSARQLDCGLRFAQPCRIHTGTEIDEHLAGPNVVAGLELYLLDDARHFRRNVGPMRGPESSHRMQPRLPFLGFSLGGGHRLRRHGL